MIIFSMNKTFKGFEGLQVYQAARQFRIKISALAKTFPEHEMYKLNSQIIRSSRSVAANIAEGYGRFHYQEFIQFCRQARGSLTETLEHLICAFDEGYLSETALKDFRNDFEDLLKLINGFISYLQKQKEHEAKQISIATNTTNTTNP